MWNKNAASFTPRPITIATAASKTRSSGISDSLMSTKSKLPTLKPIVKNPKRRITAPTCVQKKNNRAILLLGPAPQNAIKKNEGINITSKKM